MKTTGCIVLTLGLQILVPAVFAQENPRELRLKDYRPQTIYQVPRSRVDRARYPVIDMHSHVYARTDREIAEWVRVMDAVGLEKSIVLTGATGAKFDEISARYRKYPDRFSLWCGLDLTGYDQPGFGPATVAELERCAAAGAEGVGELGDKGRGLFYGEPKAWGLHFDDSRLDPIFEKCAELRLPVNIHVADPKWMYEPMDARNDGLMNAHKWRIEVEDDMLNHKQLLATLEGAVKRHPQTTFIACHFANCSHDLSLLGRLLDQYPNLFADISARFGETAPIPRYMGDFYRQYQDRLLYGTDMGRGVDMYRITFRILESADEHFYAFNYFNYHWPLHGFNLDDSILKKLYHDNAHRLLNPR